LAIIVSQNVIVSYLIVFITACAQNVVLLHEYKW